MLGVLTVDKLNPFRSVPIVLVGMYEIYFAQPLKNRFSIPPHYM